MTVLDELKALIKAFEAAQEADAKYGATDTEPDGTFQVLLARAWKGRAAAVPTTARGWELYADEPGAEAAAGRLAAAARACVDFLAGLDARPYGQVEEARLWLEAHCWRVDW